MKYAVEAYDVLVFKLKHDVTKLEDAIDKEAGINAKIICGLLNYIATHIEMDAALEVAKHYDQEFPEKQLVAYLKSLES
jgi:hypothetical protein